MSQDDSRRYKRLTLNSQINATLVVLSGTNAQYKIEIAVALKDFSKSGAGVYMSEALPKGSLVRLSIDTINLPPLDGRVVYSGKISEADTAPLDMPYRIGIDFMPRDDEARENQLGTYEEVRRIFDFMDAQKK